MMTTSGVPIKRIYTPQDNAAVDYRRDLSLLGEYPYTRGVQPTMYCAKPWTMRMFAGFGTKDLPLDKITTSMTINSPAPVIWAMYIVNAEKNGFPRAKLGGTLQNDILKEYSAQEEMAHYEG